MKMGIPQELLDETTDKVEMTLKVEKDIAFLKDRIQRMCEQSSPNTATIEVYRSLLDSRILVLDFLQEQEEITSAPKLHAVGF